MSEEQTVKSFYKNYSYKSRKPYFIDDSLLTDDQKQQLADFQAQEQLMRNQKADLIKQKYEIITREYD